MRVPPPNVLLIVFDTARADAFEPYGAGVGAGPTVAQLAARGHAYPSAIAPSSWTMPSHVGMLTGALPRSVGLASSPDGKPASCRPFLEAQRDRYLPEVFRRAGYATAAISCNTWISRVTGFDIGFDTFELAQSGRQSRMHSTSFKARTAWIREGVQARVDDGAAAAEEQLRRWLREVRTPFFWFVNLVECHSPYMPPRPYNDLSALQRYRVALEARRHLTLHEFWRSCLGGFDLAPDTVGRMRHLYGRAVRSMDDWLSRVLDALEEAGVLDDTYVIVTSDHGENFGESQLLGHSFSLDHRLIWVPLVVAGPDAMPQSGLTSLTSLPRLIAEATGLADHPWQEDAVPADLAVSQYDRNTPRDDPRVQNAIREWHLEGETLRRFLEHATAATDGRWKVVRYGAHEEVFDLLSDPWEQSPLNGHAPVEAEHALARLRAVVDEAQRPGEPPRGAPATTSGPTAEETAELEDRLRELGYL